MMSKGNMYWLLTVSLIVGGILVSTYISSSSRTQISYAQDVKPILNKNCITCHGGVKKQGKFSLLFQEEAYASTASGKPSIVPFHPEKSDFIRYIDFEISDNPFDGIYTPRSCSRC